MGEEAGIGLAEVEGRIMRDYYVRLVKELPQLLTQPLVVLAISPVAGIIWKGPDEYFGLVFPADSE